MRIKRIADWFVVSLAIVAATAWLAITGAAWGMPSPLADALLGCLSLVATAIALRHRRRASLLLLILFASVAFWMAAAMNPGISAGREVVGRLVFAGFFLLLLPGLYWYATAALGWKAIRERWLSWRACTAMMSAILLMAAGGAFLLELYRDPLLGSCHAFLPPFTEPHSDDHAVFQARILYRGGLEEPRAEIYPCSRRSWALAAVEKQYWGLPWWQRRYVFLTGMPCVKWPAESDSVFVDGRRRPGALTRRLPLFDIYCTRTKALADAGIDLRVLRDGRPKQGIRILGRTVTLTPERKWKTVAGVKLLLRRTGDSSPIETLSNEEGIFDVSGLLPGEYMVGFEEDGGKVKWFFPPECMGARRPGEGDIRDCTAIVPGQ